MIVDPFAAEVGPQVPVSGDLLEMFSTDELMEAIVTESNRYAEQCMEREGRNAQWKTKKEEISAYFGIQILGTTGPGTTSFANILLHPSSAEIGLRKSPGTYILQTMQHYQAGWKRAMTICKKLSQSWKQLGIVLLSTNHTKEMPSMRQ